MAAPALETVTYPFHSFSFAVELKVKPLAPAVGLICNASFSECDGLEMTMDAKTIREGGVNDRVVRMVGGLSFGQLTLRRGMTASFDLWDWFAAVQRDPRVRADGEVVLFAPDGGGARARFILGRCLPVKLKAPPLNAKDGIVAIEELAVAYESLVLKRPGQV